MCGIVGFLSRSNQVDHTNLELMRDSLRHRGPDDSGAWYSPDLRVGLGHRRLSIIDLSTAGHQPMLDSQHKIVVVFNGEIYNYHLLREELMAAGCSFQSDSDTEVLLQAYQVWGFDCLSHLNGMFAFALYDTRVRRLFLARDRAGEKPLFYSHGGEKLVFASELKALMADATFARSINLESLEYYLAYGYVPGDRCILNNVRKLPAGHAIAYDLEEDTLRVWRYWDLPEISDPIALHPEELESRLENLLCDSVRLRLTADVPVGVLLSGGLDSSLVTAMAAQIVSHPVKTFTISFPGHGAFNEGPYARQVANHFATDHTELVAEPATVELLPLLARQYDEPIGDHSIIPTYLVSRMIREHATVALGGDGGDELFGGYPHYNLLQRLDNTRRFMPRAARCLIGQFASHLIPVGTRGRNHLIGFGADLPYNVAHVNLYFDERTRQRLLAPVSGGGFRPGAGPEAYKSQLCAPGRSALQQATSVDFQTTMVDDYLVKVDRASMLASLEVRAPFLDHRLIEFAFGFVPDSLKATESERKILLRRLAARVLPVELDLTRKQGFSLPLASWFKGEWGSYVRTVLHESDPHLFDRSVIQSVIEGQARGYANANRLFALTMFELWRREYNVSY